MQPVAPGVSDFVVILIKSKCTKLLKLSCLFAYFLFGILLERIYVLMHNFNYNLGNTGKQVGNLGLITTDRWVTPR